MSRRLLLLVPWILLLAGPVPPAALAGRPSDARAALQGLFLGVEARRGIQHRSLVVVALVSRKTDVEEDEVMPAVSAAGLKWQRISGKTNTRIDATRVADPRLLPTGTLLGEGPGERILAMPLSASPRTTAEGFAVRVPSRLAVPSGATRIVVGLAGPEWRQVVTTHPHADALAALLRLERALAGLPERDEPGPLLAVREGQFVSEPRHACAKALSPLPKSYGGAICGHVAFLGNRPIEVVVAASPAVYRTYAREAIEGLATYTALWEELYGRTDEVIEPVAWPQVQAVARRVLDNASKAKARRTTDTDTWRLGAKGASRLGWVLLDEAAKGLLAEAWPLGDEGPFPVPAYEPGGKPINDRPDAPTHGGTMTPEYLERLLERLKERR